MNFYSYSVPTLDLSNPDHRALIQQFVSACKRELEIRKRLESKFPNKPTIKTRTSKKQRMSLVSG